MNNLGMMKMNPSAWLILIVTVLYLGIAISKVFYKDYYMAGMWFGYFLANVALFSREFSI